MTDTFGTPSTADAVMTVKAAGAAPIIAIAGPSTREFNPKVGFKLSSLLVAESVCAGAVTYEWASGDEDGVWFPNDTPVNRKTLVVEGAARARAGQGCERAGAARCLFCALLCACTRRGCLHGCSVCSQQC